MSPKSSSANKPAEQVVKDIRRVTPAQVYATRLQNERHPSRYGPREYVLDYLQHTRLSRAKRTRERQSSLASRSPHRRQPAVAKRWRSGTSW